MLIPSGSNVGLFPTSYLCERQGTCSFWEVSVSHKPLFGAFLLRVPQVPNVAPSQLRLTEVNA
jgi:hypothetical protein